MNQEIKKILKKLQGAILVVGLDSNEFMKVIDENKEIVYCDFLNLISDNKKEEGSSGQVLNIRKLRKKYKKNKFDYILVEINDVKDYLKYFVKDSIYLCKKKIYIFNNDCEKLESMYQRYDVDIETKIVKNDRYLIIDVSRASNKLICDIGYFLYDTLVYLVDKLSEVLTR